MYILLITLINFFSIDPSRFITLAEQVVEFLPQEELSTWYSPSTYDSKGQPKAAKGILSQKYESLRSEADKKLHRFLGSKKQNQEKTSASYGNFLKNVYMSKKVIIWSIFMIVYL